MRQSLLTATLEVKDNKARALQFSTRPVEQHHVENSTRTHSEVKSCTWQGTVWSTGRDQHRKLHQVTK